MRHRVMNGYVISAVVMLEGGLEVKFQWSFKTIECGKKHM